MKFCMKCGAFYEEKDGGGCPRCAENERLHAAAEAAEIDHGMDPEAARRARRRAWLELCIGVPAFIGVIYLVIYLIRALRGG
ncbi:hypothetical protein MR810_05365 [bacterium]|nr:hypothetical protein [bacterium]MDD5917595.1 hypothetical protein [bacterium]MDD6047356.1 hypothetical protein [bacterium]